jgi:sporulation protein YlmC with PRC-barrel domain
MAERALSFTMDLLGKPVLDRANRSVGRVEDLATVLGAERPAITHLIAARRPTRGWAGRLPFGRGSGPVALPWTEVKAVEGRSVRLRRAAARVQAVGLTREQVRLRRDIMDQQIVDSRGQKVLRVNDICLAAEGAAVSLVGVETGLLGLLVRLGSRRRLPGLMRLLGIPVEAQVIPWAQVASLDERRGRILLKVSKAALRAGPDGGGRA